LLEDEVSRLKVENQELQEGLAKEAQVFASREQSMQSGFKEQVDHLASRLSDQDKQVQQLKQENKSLAENLQAANAELAKVPSKDSVGGKDWLLTDCLLLCRRQSVQAKDPHTCHY